MKIIDWYILRSFIKPFISTFLIIIFILVLQALWLAFSEIASKGIGLYYILKLLGYLALQLSTKALPIAVLLSSIMTLGNLSENYEFAALKSSGVSLFRTIRPLFIFVFLLSALNFVLYNNVFPWATFKQRNLQLNIQKRKPALALVTDAFNTDIPGYSIKFEERYGKDKNQLKNIQIADLRKNNGKLKIITAKSGILTSDEGSKYLSLTLKNGYFYEEHYNSKVSYQKRKRMPASKASFDSYTINIDISSFSDNSDLSAENIKRHYEMLSIKQLDSMSKVSSEKYHLLLDKHAKYLNHDLTVKSLYKYPDSLIKTLPQVNHAILENFDDAIKVNIISSSISKLNRIMDQNRSQIKVFKVKRKVLNLFDFSSHNRFSFSLTCLVLFFIGAPLGAVIRKGGFGLPMVISICIFMMYHFISSLTKNLSEESVVTAFLGGWIPTAIFLVVGLYLMLKIGNPFKFLKKK